MKQHIIGLILFTYTPSEVPTGSHLAGMADIVAAAGAHPFLVADLEQIAVAAYHCSLMVEVEKSDPFQSLAEETNKSYNQKNYKRI